MHLTTYFIINHDLTRHRFYKNGRKRLGNLYYTYLIIIKKNILTKGIYKYLSEIHKGFSKNILYDLQVIYIIKYNHSYNR